MSGFGGILMGKYSYELKLEIVRENEDGYGAGYLARKYGLDDSTVKNWIQLYQDYGEDGLKKSMSKIKYTGEFKLYVLKYRQVNSLSYREAAEYFNIKNPSTIANWQRKYDSDGLDGLYGSVGSPNKLGDTDMAKKETKPRDLTKSELEELIELRQTSPWIPLKVWFKLAKLAKAPFMNGK